MKNSDTTDISSPPVVSVVIPTYKRLGLLKRAIDSVMRQTISDWELIVSDDEEPPGETWDYLQNLEKTDARLRVLRNPGPHGQVGNVNFALRAARGTWVKPLYDDDVLHADCLEVMLDAARGREAVAMVSCGCDYYVDNQLRRSYHSRSVNSVELIPQKYVHLGLYLQEDVGGGIPTQVMVRRSCIEKGAVFEPVAGLVSGVDSWWNARVLQHGDSVVIRQALVDAHQGLHESVTSQMSQEALDEEFLLLRRLQLPLIDPSLRPPSLRVITQMLRLIRAASRLSKGQLLAAIKLAGGAWDPRAWWLAGRWMLRQKFAGKFSSVPRQQFNKQ